MRLKILISHFIITAIIITFISISDFSDNAYFMIYIFSLFLYLLSGYLSTEKKTSWYNYFIVSFIGLVIWGICFISSPNDLNYKGHEGGIWFFYQLYIMVSSPLNFIDSIQDYLNGNRKTQLFGDLIILILFSVFQYFGGIIKMAKSKKLDTLNEKQSLTAVSKN